MNRLCLMLLLALAACAHAPAEPVEPQVRTQTVNVAVPVPCKALVELGPEPEYPDTPEAIQQAETIADVAVLYAQGRAMRVQRLAAYAVAKAACVF